MTLTLRLDGAIHRETRPLDEEAYRKDPMILDDMIREMRAAWPAAQVRWASAWIRPWEK